MEGEKLPLATPKRAKSSAKLQNLQRAASQGSQRAQAELAKLEESLNDMITWLEGQCDIIGKANDAAGFCTWRWFQFIQGHHGTGAHFDNFATHAEIL